MTDQTAPIYYISPTNKIHSNQCRHFKADTDGWQKMGSYSDAISTGAKPCKICCPKTSEIKVSESGNEPDLSESEIKINESDNKPDALESKIKINDSENKPDTLEPEIKINKSGNQAEALKPEIRINDSGNKPNLSEKEVSQTTKGKEETTANPPIKPKKKSNKADTTSPKQQDLFAQPISTTGVQSLSLTPNEDEKTQEQSESPITEQEDKKQEQPLSSTPAEEGSTTEKSESFPIKDEDSTIEKSDSSPINDDDKIKEQLKSSSTTKEDTTEGDSIKEDATKEEQSESVTSNNDNTLKQSESSTPSEDEEVKSKKDKGKKTQSKNKKKKEKKPPVKKYKILAGNGCHQAIAEVQGILVPPIDAESSHQLILPDGSAIEATFAGTYLKWLAFNQPNISGAHWFRGYPKMQNDKLVAFQIIGWDGNMPTTEKGWEKWEFIGVWTLQKNLTVQRSMGDKDIRDEARKTGYIKKFKFTFTNTQDWLKQKKLWIGYVYKLICRREGDTLKIQKVIPYACPRFKPVPKTKPVKKKAEEKATKPKQDSQTDSQPQGEGADLAKRS